MLENTVNMIEGIKSGKKESVLLAQADPLGLFPELKNIGIMD